MRGSKLVKRVSVLMFVLLIVSFLSSVGFICPGQASLVTISGQWDTVWITPTTHAYCVQNNVWNPDSGWEQELQVDDQTGAFTVTKSNANATHVVSYPSIFKGNSWGTATNNSDMPMQVSGLSVETSWNISTIDSGVWNAAYDVWFHKTSNYTGGAPNGAELMIWISYTASMGNKVGTVSLAGATWDVYYWTMTYDSASWNYIAYLRTSNTTYVSFNLNTFVTDSVSRGYIQNSWYLVAVDAGFEIWRGGVGLTSNSFSVTPSQDVTITIDGDMSDWEGVEPLHVDEVGDTQPWSTDTDLLSIGSTAETPAQVPINDKVRDLKAVYIYNDTQAIYVRLDVNSLIEDWEYPQKNASIYVVAFDTDFTIGSGMDDLSMACDTYTNSWASWERIFCWYTSAGAWVQDPSWATIDTTSGSLMLAQNATVDAFEFSIPRTDFPAEWSGQPLAITVISFKPGEYPTSGEQQWLHAFDVQAPGTPGEVWGDPGSSAQGSDVADVIPGGVDGVDSSGRVKDFLTVFAPIPNYVNIGVDCQNFLGRIRSLQGVNNGPITTDEAYNLSTYYIDIGVDWVRLHDLWGSIDIHWVFPNFNADPTKPENYDFTSTDLHIGAIKSIGADIIYRLGYSWGENAVPPSNYTQWASICVHIIKHYNDGWANGFHYNITYWEIWNEPDIPQFWIGTPEEYFSLYNVTANTIKSYDPNLKVGGPCIAFDLDFLEDFLNSCRTYSVPLDFVSWHVYGGNPYEVYLRAEAVENVMETCGFSSLESVLTEWNKWADWDEWDSLRNNPAIAAFTASGLIYLQNSSTDIANYYRGDTHNWGGLFNSDGTPGKALYAFKAFKMLLDTHNRVYCNGSDTQGYATIAGISDDNRTVTVLVSDYGSISGGYDLTVQNLPWGEWAFKYDRYVLNENLNLELVESEILNSTSFSTTEEMWSPFVHLIRLSAVSLGVTPKYTFYPPNPAVNYTVTFDASGSFSWNGTHFIPIVSYQWDFGDGAKNTTINPIITHKYVVNDTYTVTLNVTDSQGLWNTTSKTIEILQPRNVAVIWVSPSATDAYPTWVVPLQINVTVKNNGTFIESFSVTLYWNNTNVIDTKSVTLNPRETKTITYTWNIPTTPATYPYPTYVLSANATLPEDNYPADNTLTDGTITIKHPGDTDGDGECYTLDFSNLVIAYREGVTKPYEHPECDFDGDGKVYTLDFSILVLNYRWGTK